ncbi:LysR family transcriptional regulator [Saccharopolyspora sp. K220]|uniref:LysR family transcriptional regulator n=1 Tax=Saccharopolyspora soli TaxID=2926618 RepID=UPI001F55CFE7|nr:LysR substrate-binding domain-containing protein [Saccharopolyspora soli]MCI2415991.1 LysR family transcriptional regulator [Saccharopolyspora soli]
MKEHGSSLANLDLNLLVFLRELLRARNVTRAAERIGVTQPTTSAALARLRRHFDDELLVRRRGGYVLSPLAVELAAQIEPLCEAAERLFTTAPFDPATTRREYKLLMPDYVLDAVGEAVSRALYAQAQGAKLHVMLVTGALPSDAVEALRLIDGLASAPTARLKLSGLRCAELFRDRWVCVVDADTVPINRTRLETAELERRPWVVPHHPGGDYPPTAPLAPLMMALAVNPEVAVRVDSYRATPHFVAGTDRVAVIQERLARRFANRTDLRILEYPGEPEPIVECLWWHEKHETDPAHRWMRETIRAAAQNSGP